MIIFKNWIIKFEKVILNLTFNMYARLKIKNRKRGVTAV